MNVKSLAHTVSGAIGASLESMFENVSGSRPMSSGFRGVLERLAGFKPNFFITRASRFSLIPSATAVDF